MNTKFFEVGKFAEINAFLKFVYSEILSLVTCLVPFEIYTWLYVTLALTSKLSAFPHTVSAFSYHSLNKKRLLPPKSLTDWISHWRRSVLNEIWTEFSNIIRVVLHRARIHWKRPEWNEVYRKLQKHPPGSLCSVQSLCFFFSRHQVSIVDHAGLYHGWSF
jgi:hypothetical protein